MPFLFCFVLFSFIICICVYRILKFIEDENDEELIVLVGGHAAEHVASDPDPDKRDIKKVFGPILNEEDTF